MEIEGVGYIKLIESGSQVIISNDTFRFAYDKITQKHSYRFNFQLFKESERIKAILIEYCQTLKI